jgi:pimeloyl-ACP methyl ester carboxylesterase/heat shock protein HslJ
MTLGVMRLLSSAESPAEPLFVASGGPGGSLMDSVPLVAAAVLEDETSSFAQLLSNRDIVYFTQRGTLYADPALMCDLDQFDPYLNAVGAGSPVEEREQAEVDSFKACYDSYVDAGVDFTAYNSVESAADVDSIREALGYDQIVYYGESYGTLLGQHVMRDFAETLTAVILDGAVPISAPSWVAQLDAKYQASLDYVIGLCAADEACSEAYPNLADDMERVYQDLQSEPYTFTPPIGVTIPLDENLASISIYDSFYSPALAANLPLAVDSILNDREDERINSLLTRFFPSLSSLSWLTHYAVICSEDPINSVDDATSLDDPSYSVISEFIRSDTFEYAEMCKLMNLPVLPDETDAPINSELPVLLLSGAFDPITPAFTAEEILATLPNSFAFEFPYGGHVQFLTGNTCAESMVAAFIADPATEPDSSCIAETLPLEFALPAETGATDQSALTSEFWLWTSFTSPAEAFDVDMPENYLLVFNEAGTVNIGADCNNASGSYTFDGSSLTIELGPVTMAACEEGSHSDQFVTLLGSAAIAFFEDGNLYIDLMADGGTMVFTPEE